MGAADGVRNDLAPYLQWGRTFGSEAGWAGKRSMRPTVSWGGHWLHWSHRWWVFIGYSTSPDLAFFASLKTSRSQRMLFFLASFDHRSSNPSPRAGLQLPPCTPARCLMSQRYFDTPPVEPHGLSSPHRLDVVRCKQRPQSLAWRRDVSYIYPNFFNKFRAFYTKGETFLLAGNATFCVLL